MKTKYTLLLIFAVLLLFFVVKYFQQRSDIFDTFDTKVSGKNFIEKRSGAFDALQWWNIQRAFPDEEIAIDKYYTEYIRAKEIFGERDNINSRDTWDNIGPNNVGGRTLVIAVNPVDTNIVWLGAASGGLWKSTTGGIGAQAWTHVPTAGIPTLGVSSIVIDSINPNIMYVGTGETYNYQQALNGLSIRVTRGSYGMGILKTTNGGLNWTKSLDWTYQQNRGVWDIVSDPLNLNVLYAGTTEGIFKTTNAGNNWIQVFTEKMVMDLAIDRLNPNIIYAGVGNLGSLNPGLYRTMNNGNSWTKLTNGLPPTNTGRTSITTYHNNPKIIIASIGNDLSTVGLYRTTDQGNSWTQLSGTPDFLSYQGWFAKCVQIKNDDSSKVLVGGVSFYKSTTSGSNLIVKNTGGSFNGFVPAGGPEGPPNYMHVDFHDIVSNPKEPNKVYIAGDGGLFRSNDFGETFYGCNGGYVSTQFYNGFTNSSYDSTIALGGLQDNSTVRYSGTDTWYRTSGGDGVMTAINPTNHNIMFCCSQYLTVYRSTNQGATGSWTTVLSGGSANFVAPLLMCPSNPNVLYAGRNQVMKSTNGGLSGSWVATSSPLDGNSILSLAVSYTSTDTVYAATVPSTSIPMGFFRSINGGTNWTNISSGLPNRYPTDIAVNPQNSSDIYAVFSGFNTPHVFRSMNSGSSWININGNLPDVPFQAIVVDPQFTSNVYAGNDFGVYVSTNSGTNWNSFTDGISPAAMIFDLSISKSNRKIRAVTHGNGVFERSLLEGIVGIGNNTSTIPESFRLYQNYPNPFNPVTKILFDIPSDVKRQTSNVKLIVYDIMGKEISTLVNQQLNEGSYNVDFNGANYPSGNYFYKLEAGDFSEVKKMILLK